LNDFFLILYYLKLKSISQDEEKNDFEDQNVFEQDLLAYGNQYNNLNSDIAEDIDLYENQLDKTYIDEEEDDEEKDDEEEFFEIETSPSDSLFIDYQTTSYSHRCCFVCKVLDQPMVKITTEGIVDLFIKTNILIKFGSRCCVTHLTDNRFLKDSEIKSLIVIKKERKINIKSVKNLLESLRSNCINYSTNFSKFGDVNLIDSDFCFRNTGFYKDEFILIANQLKIIKNSPQRTKFQALAVYLFWLKTGLSQEIVATHFDKIDRNEVKNYCIQIRNDLIKSMVPMFLGVKSKTR